jgi:two-component system, NarL family, nitrate/nitrite response regulator NarL
MNSGDSRHVDIVIADDHPIFRDGLRRCLESAPELRVLGEASDGAEAVRLARELKPDILLLDLAMPKHSGLEALRDLSTGSNSTPVRVILLAAAAEKSQIVEALQLGARGVVLKDSTPQLMLKAIHTVMSGEYWVGRESVSNLVQYLRTLVQSSSDGARQKKFGLTPRELEIIAAVVAGYSNKEIAEYFKISEDTVKHNLRNSFQKLPVPSRRHLARLAVGNEHVSDFVQYLRAMSSAYDEDRQKKADLSSVELEIIAKVVASYSTQELAEHLKMSEDQLEEHLKDIIAKLGDPGEQE